MEQIEEFETEELVAKAVKELHGKDHASHLLDSFRISMASAGVLATGGVLTVSVQVDSRLLVDYVVCGRGGLKSKMLEEYEAAVLACLEYHVSDCLNSLKGVI